MGFHNVNVYPNGSPIGKGLHLSSQEDPFGDYASVDTEHALADERVFGVLKLTKLAATGSQRVQGLRRFRCIILVGLHSYKHPWAFLGASSITSQYRWWMDHQWDGFWWSSGEPFQDTNCKLCSRCCSGVVLKKWLVFQNMNNLLKLKTAFLTFDHHMIHNLPNITHRPCD